jgi:hypothetical protein
MIPGRSLDMVAAVLITQVITVSRNVVDTYRQQCLIAVLFIDLSRQELLRTARQRTQED